MSICSSAKKKDSDLVAAVSRASGLEGQLNKSEATLSTALSQNAALTSELADAKNLLAKVCTAVFPLKCSVKPMQCLCADIFCDV